MNRKSALYYSISSFLIFFGVSSLQYHSILIESKGISGTGLGILVMAGYLAAVAAPFAMTIVGAKFPNTVVLLLLLCIGAGASLPLMAYFSGFWELWILFFFYNFCVFSIFPIHMTLGLELCSGKNSNMYFVFRAIGTAGFVVGCVLCSQLSKFLDFKGLYLVLSLAFLLAVIFILLQPKGPVESIKKETAAQPLKGIFSSYSKAFKIFTEPGFKFLVLIIFLVSLSNTLAIGVQGNYIIHNFSGDASLVSLSWVVCSGFEIPIMFLCMFLIKRYGVGAVIIAGVAGSLIRINLMSAAPNLTVLFMGLSLHGFFYAGIITGLGIRIHKSPHIKKAASQSFISLFYTGLPSVIGGFLSGFIWDHFSLKSVYIFSQIVIWIAAFLWILFYYLGKGQIDLDIDKKSHFGPSESSIP